MYQSYKEGTILVNLQTYQPTSIIQLSDKLNRFLGIRKKI